MATETSSDEKLMAALSYWGSILLLVPTLVIYLIKKDESAFIKKHAVQSLAFGLVTLAVSWVVFPIISTVLGAVTLGIGALIFLPIQLIFSLGCLAYVIYLGVLVFQGEDPEIPIISEKIQGFLNS